jgi:hypothetical protein
MPTKKRLIQGVIGVAGLALVVWGLFYCVEIFGVVIGVRHAITKKEQVILYSVDHAALGTILREFASVHRWSSAQTSGAEMTFLHGDEPSLSPGLRILKPSSVRIYDDQIDLEFGGALLHFGISAFRPGLPGQGTKNLGDGLWFYSEDGRVPKED